MFLSHAAGRSSRGRSMRPGRFSNRCASPVIRRTPRTCSFWCSACAVVRSSGCAGKTWTSPAPNSRSGGRYNASTVSYSIGRPRPKHPTRRFHSCLSARSRCTIAQPPMTGTRRLPVLTGRLGSGLHDQDEAEPRNFNRSFAAACSRAHVRSIPVHATRKTCASLLVALDVHPRVGTQVLRHSQISVTMNIYSEVSSDATRCALKRLGKRLDTERLLYRTAVRQPKGPVARSQLALDLWVELRGFEPLTPSMRTRCATGLRYSPRT